MEEKNMIKTERTKVYGQMEEVAEGRKDPEAFRFVGGAVVSADQAEAENPGEGIQTAREKNY